MVPAEIFGTGISADLDVDFNSGIYFIVVIFFSYIPNTLVTINYIYFTNYTIINTNYLKIF